MLLHERNDTQFKVKDSVAEHTEMVLFRRFEVLIIYLINFATVCEVVIEIFGKYFI